jgi:uncharacterized protein (DUF1800 family)
MLSRRLMPLAFVIVPALLLGSAARAVDLDEARHLVSRTGLGVTPNEIAALRPLTYDQAVDKLLAGARTKAVTPPPAWAAEPFHLPRLKQMSEEERKEFRRTVVIRAVELRGWWYQEMTVTPSPLTEHMTLFWSNHFTSSLQKVKWPQFIYGQNVLLRREALGNFATMLHDIARDPAMIVYLDNATNRKGKPNENFARELLELFTLGEGHYSERDIKEAARAFTGWSIDRETGEFRVYPRLHDDGEKTFMGVTGKLGGDDIIDIVLRQPRVAEFITEKMWREFISDTPNRDEVRAIAARFRSSRYDIKTLVAGILTTPSFRGLANRGVLVKSPVELMVGTVRLFNAGAGDGEMLARVGRRLGQDLMNPPNVKGWPGGDAWITADTLLVRQQMLTRVAAGQAMMVQGKNGKRMAAASGDGLDSWLQSLPPDLRERANLAALLLPIKPVSAPADNTDPERFVAQILLDPAYELK